MNQTVMPFKLSATDESLTSHAGLALLGEFMAAMKVPAMIDHHLPLPRSGRGFMPSVYIQSLILMLHGGGRSLEDLRMLSNDDALKTALGITVPSSDAVGDWLRRMGKGSAISDLLNVRNELLAWALNQETRDAYTLDIDATQITAEKYAAQCTYKNEKGYMPIAGHLAENGLIVHEEFREGNEAPASDNRAFIKACKANMPKGKHITRLRADSATYQTDVINDCEHDGVMFAIGAKKDPAVIAAIQAIAETDWVPFGDGALASVIHSMEKTRKAFRLIVFRRGKQQELDGHGDAYFYHVIATNRTDDPATIMRWYRMRGVDDVERATLIWVEWFNNRRIMRPLGDMPPLEYEELYYRQTEYQKAA
ncbi:MAG: IS1380 family transposase [Zetaproteobacteria bacterium]|nr:IS1380 family transposase [Zetaproteobacteria bacterium]